MREARARGASRGTVLARQKWIAWGVAVAAVYFAAAAYPTGAPWTGGPAVPVRVIYDGMMPLPPYQWVRPPANFPHENKPPEAGAGTVRLTASGSDSGAITTGDDQAAVLFARDAIASRLGETVVKVTIRPLDPATVGPPPADMTFDGNAYLIEAVYSTSQAPVQLRKPATVALRFPAIGTQVLRWNGSAWIALRSTAIPPAMQDVADSDALGIFVPAAPHKQGPSLSTVLYRTFTILLWAAAAVLLIGLVRDYARTRVRRK